MSSLKPVSAQACSRRRFLQVGSCSMLGLGLADALRAQAMNCRHAPNATSVILIWLDGGPATIDMWDPKPEAPQNIRGEFKSIPTSVPGVHVCEIMPRTALALDHCVLVRSLHHNIPDHLPGAQYVMTGNKPSAALEYPSLGSLAGHLLASSRGMPAYFTIGSVPNSGAGFLGPAFNPFRVSNLGEQVAIDLDGVTLPERLSLESLSSRRTLLKTFDRKFRNEHASADVELTLSRFQAEALDILTSDRIARAFDLTREPEAMLDNYGRGQLGRHALAARRLIEAGARFVSLSAPGWDTHAGNFTSLRQLAPPLDRALATLITDLDQRGMLDQTLVVCGGEFGRTPIVNSAGGRDHWSRAMSVLLAGGGLRRGHVHGATDERGFDPAEAPCTPDDLAATLLTLLGFPHDEQVLAASGRPVKLAEFGKPIGEIIA